MLTKEESDFIDYWERNRDKERKTFRQFLIGIPVGLLFAIPITVNFYSGWYKRAAMVRNADESSPLVLLIALLIVIGFIAVFSKRHQWEMHEQKYRELLAKRAKDKISTIVETK
ncbi:MAG: hypothetical protein JST47_11870 [Bacteroidetes bacterium]|nr:hypothetical protein [Bacteroidota bacterium]MBS1974347.1 hypothetical protein [Bacteroidota bacterium]